MTKTIQLTKGRRVIVDAVDYELLSQYNWHCTSHGYAARRNSNDKIVYMHRIIMNAEKHQLVDHKDRNGLNNQRSNLRLCTKAQNQQNCKRPISNTSGYRGVSTSGKRWKAAISIKDKTKHLGCFADKIEAAKAYDKAAIKYFGEFAVLNFKENE